MSFELFNTLTAYGDHIGFHTKFDENIILDKLQEFSDDWAEYNPRTTTVNNRWGLSITNHNGELGAGPDLDSLPQYNEGVLVQRLHAPVRASLLIEYSVQKLHNLVDGFIC